MPSDEPKEEMFMLLMPLMKVSSLALLWWLAVACEVIDARDAEVEVLLVVPEVWEGAEGRRWMALSRLLAAASLLLRLDCLTIMSSETKKKLHA